MPGAVDKRVVCAVRGAPVCAFLTQANIPMVPGGGPGQLGFTEVPGWTFPQREPSAGARCGRISPCSGYSREKQLHRPWIKSLPFLWLHCRTDRILFQGEKKKRSAWIDFHIHEWQNRVDMIAPIIHHHTPYWQMLIKSTKWLFLKILRIDEPATISFPRDTR